MRVIAVLLLLTTTTETRSFPICKVIRVNCKLMKKNTLRTVSNQVKTLAQNEEDILEKSVSILSDNAVNEMLYLLKFYHFTNDTTNSFIYILIYETIWVGFQMKKKDLLGENFDLNSDASKTLLKQLLINITLYIIMKNIFINNIIHVINIPYLNE